VVLLLVLEINKVPRNQVHSEYVNLILMKAIFLFLAILSFSNKAQAQNFDIDLLRKINVERNSNFDAPYLFITKSTVPFGLSAPTVMLAVGLIKKDSLLTQNSLMIIGGLAINGIVTTAMKYGFNRDRPFTSYPDIVKLTGGESPSFPSGHTSLAFSVATSVSIAYPKWYVIAPSFLWASAVGYSRMHLGVHYPSDVFVGALVGSGTAWLGQIITKKIQLKRSTKGLRL
jgi:membrane-associated phospholipid phosphatase